METQAHPAELAARPLIEQCRREVAAAWGYINAAGEILSRSRVLAAQWAEQKRIEEDEEANLDAPDRSEAARVGMFVGVGLEARWHKRRRRTVRAEGVGRTSLTPSARADRRSRRQSASG
jgi:hypothetical protein